MINHTQKVHDDLFEIVYEESDKDRKVSDFSAAENSLQNVADLESRLNLVSNVQGLDNKLVMKDIPLQNESLNQKSDNLRQNNLNHMFREVTTQQELFRRK